ncbi:MAG: amidohydrolase family protein, partial [Candidatus Dormibacteraeota bacterium]|nr:amidohydrolase family protein [Candidatus Dormibacteraeota bacterium]
MRCVLRGVRVIDPAADRDDRGMDVWIDGGSLRAIDRRIDAAGIAVIDLTPDDEADACVICPAFIDLHAHLREPGDEDAETVMSGCGAAAAGGYAAVVAMANTRVPIDSPDRVRQALARGERAPVTVLQAAALTRGLHGQELTDVASCIAAGAVAISDDGRNAAPVELVSQALVAAAGASRAVLVHVEDEADVARLNPGASMTRAPLRPADAESHAVSSALEALRNAGAGRLHLQHVSTAASVEQLRRGRAEGLAVTAEVTPHHLSLVDDGATGERDPLRKVNPPLRSDADRHAVAAALRDGVIDAVATDHAPHRMTDKAAGYEAAPPGMIGLETALALCITHGGFSGDALGVLVARLTTGPRAVLGDAIELAHPRLLT